MMAPKRGNEVVGIMKIRIREHLIEDYFCPDQLHVDWSQLPQIIGLSAKTLQELDKGGMHKIETVFQLESKIGFHVANDEHEDASDDIYCDPSDLAEYTAARHLWRERIYAIALPSSGLIKLIEDWARHVLDNAVTNEGHERGVAEARSRLAFDNYLHNHNAISETQEGRDSSRGDRAQFEFSIDEEVGPLTKAQKKYVLELDECINALIKRCRAAGVQKASTLRAALELDRGDSLRKRLIEIIASLKRVNINVLAYARWRDTRVFDSSDFEPPEYAKNSFGPDSEYYLFSFRERVVHIVIAPARYLRIPVPIEPSVDWQPEPMWGAKVSKDGTHFDYVSDLESAESTERPTAERDNIVALVPTPDAQSERND